MIEIKTTLKDEKAFLVEFELDKITYVFLYDTQQDAIFLSQKEKEINLRKLWESHLKDKEYCLPCELMLHFDKKFIMVVNYPPLEIDFSFKKAQRILMELNKIINLPNVVKERIGIEKWATN